MITNRCITTHLTSFQMQTLNEVRVFELAESSVKVVVVVTVIIKKEIIINPPPQKRIENCIFLPVHPAAIAAAVDLAGGSQIPPKTAAAPALLFCFLTFLVQFEFLQVFPAPVEPLRSAFSPLLCTSQ